MDETRGRCAPNGDEAVSSGKAAGVSGGYNITFNYIIRGRGRDITVRAEIEDENIDIRKRYSTVRGKGVKNTKNKKKKREKNVFRCHLRRKSSDRETIFSFASSS